MPNKKPTFKKEQELWNQGIINVCGIDEAGRGSLAGPIVCGAVILSKEFKHILNDSKKLSAKKRGLLFKLIQEQSVAYSYGVSSVEEIEKHGIQSATYLAGHRAIKALKIKPDFYLIDHYRFPALDKNQISITFGDKLSKTISAASIVAKVVRDQIMLELSEDDNLRIYSFDKNLGYGTRFHMSAISKNGASLVHRKSFLVDNQAQTSFNFK